MDNITSKITKNKPALVLIGAANMSPSSPIKKYKRCPGTRKLATSLKKNGKCDVAYVDEYYTSQKCGRCFQQFTEGTRADRTKICLKCSPLDEAEPASVITSCTNKRKLAALRRQKQEEQEQQHQIQHQQTFSTATVSKRMQYIKKTQLLPATEEENVGITIWHRDISAAKLIRYKGNRMNCFFVNYIYTLILLLYISVYNRDLRFSGGRATSCFQQIRALIFT